MLFESDIEVDNLTFNHLQKIYDNESKKSENELNQKNLIVRSTGRFYTHEFIGRTMIKSMFNSFQVDNFLMLKVIEPFCGDGRLICWLLEEAKQRTKNKLTWQIELWDCDYDALSDARRRIESTARTLNYKVEVTTRAGDSFKLAKSHTNKYDICITNPPWEVLKPDSRELKNLNKQEAEAYIQNIREMNKSLSELYPLSVPTKKFAGWGMNLARCGTEVAINLTAKDGICGVVSPASLLADQMSECLRRWIFETNNVSSIHYYVAEAKLFYNVDQPCIAFVASPGTISSASPSLITYDKNCNPNVETLNDSDWNHIVENGYILPLQFGLKIVAITKKFGRLQTISCLEGMEDKHIWAGRELDETGYQSYLSDNGEYLFAKGKMIRRYGFAEKPSKYVKNDGPQIPKSADLYRLVWRDVARPTQKRRMHAAIIPPGMVTGNSLNVLYFRDNNVNRLKALVAIMNSFVFEAQARMHLATAHVSLGAVRKVRIPDITNENVVQSLVQLVDNYIDKNDESYEEMIEVFVAKMYDLSYGEFSTLLSSFDKLTTQEREQLLQRWNEGKENN